jgi:hypothetical protein
MSDPVNAKFSRSAQAPDQAGDFFKSRSELRSKDRSLQVVVNDLFEPLSSHV